VLWKSPMKRTMLMLAGLIFTGAAVSQDLPPGVLLLSRVKAHMSEEFHRLTTLSCLETVQREHQAAKARMRPLDTIRLEVLTTGDKELFASPGDRKFSENHPMSYAGSGAMGDGLFRSYLKDILLSDSIASQYKGEEEVGGLRLARYDYRIPLLISGQTIQTPEGVGKVGLHGSYWVDPRTYDVLRLQMDAEDFPPNLPVTEMATTINYARTRLGNGLEVLLPEAAELRLAKSSGEINHNRVEFTHCRVFGAESTISFNGPDTASQSSQFGSAAVDDTLRTLPVGLQIAIKLRNRISGDMAVGTLIDGVVAGNVTVKRSVLIPEGSTLRGRIRRMERSTDPFPYFVVGLEFTEVELHGVRHLFYADLVDFDPIPGLTQGLSTKNTTTMANPLLFGDLSTRQTTESISLPRLPGVATFFYKGARLDLPQDFRTVWKTRALKP
jgi:hypothetical protein